MGSDSKRTVLDQHDLCPREPSVFKLAGGCISPLCLQGLRDTCPGEQRPQGRALPRTIPPRTYCGETPKAGASQATEAFWMPWKTLQTPDSLASLSFPGATCMLDNEDTPFVRRSHEDMNLGLPMGSKISRTSRTSRHPGFLFQTCLSPQPLRRKERPLAACEPASSSPPGSELLAL